MAYIRAFQSTVFAKLHNHSYMNDNKKNEVNKEIKKRRKRIRLKIKI